MKIRVSYHAIVRYLELVGRMHNYIARLRYVNFTDIDIVKHFEKLGFNINLIREQIMPESIECNITVYDSVKGCHLRITDAFCVVIVNKTVVTVRMNKKGAYVPLKSLGV